MKIQSRGWKVGVRFHNPQTFPEFHSKPTSPTTLFCVQALKMFSGLQNFVQFLAWECVDNNYNGCLSTFILLSFLLWCHLIYSKYSLYWWLIIMCLCVWLDVFLSHIRPSTGFMSGLVCGLNPVLHTQFSLSAWMRPVIVTLFIHNQPTWCRSHN